MNAKRAKAIERLQLEKARLATGVTEDELSQPPKTTLTFSKHFMIEPQADESDPEQDVYAIYRMADLLSSVVSDTGETPAPVHVCDLAVDAGMLVCMLDKLVDVENGDDDEVLTDMQMASLIRTCDNCGKPYGP